MRAVGVVVVIALLASIVYAEALDHGVLRINDIEIPFAGALTTDAPLSGELIDTLAKGAGKIYPFNEKEYDFYVSNIYDSVDISSGSSITYASFKINNQGMTIRDGNSYVLADNSKVCVTKFTKDNDIDTVTFSLGSKERACERCVDSDAAEAYPDGKNPDLKGLAWFGSEGRTDCCKDGVFGGPCQTQGTYLYEAFCDNRAANSYITQCTFGCAEGACLPSPCTADEIWINGLCAPKTSTTPLKIKDITTAEIRPVEYASGGFGQHYFIPDISKNTDVFSFLNTDLYGGWSNPTRFYDSFSYTYPRMLSIFVERASTARKLIIETDKELITSYLPAIEDFGCYHLADDGSVYDGVCNRYEFTLNSDEAMRANHLVMGKVSCEFAEMHHFEKTSGRCKGNNLLVDYVNWPSGLFAADCVAEACSGACIDDNERSKIQYCPDQEPCCIALGDCNTVLNSPLLDSSYGCYQNNVVYDYLLANVDTPAGQGVQQVPTVAFDCLIESCTEATACKPGYDACVPRPSATPLAITDVGTGYGAGLGLSTDAASQSAIVQFDIFSGGSLLGNYYSYNRPAFSDGGFLAIPSPVYLDVHTIAGSGSELSKIGLDTDAGHFASYVPADANMFYIADDGSTYYKNELHDYFSKGLSVIEAFVPDHLYTAHVSCPFALENNFEKIGDAQCDGNTLISDYVDTEHGLFAFDCVEECGQLRICNAASASCKSKCQVTQENNEAQDIPDHVPISSKMQVGHSWIIENLKIEVDIQHTNIGDLVIDLVSPQGTTYRVWDRAGGSKDNIHQRFDGKIFTGEQIQGEWILYIRDWYSGWNAGTGRLNYWKLFAAKECELIDCAAAQNSILTEEIDCRDNSLVYNYIITNDAKIALNCLKEQCTADEFCRDNTEECLYKYPSTTPLRIADVGTEYGYGIGMFQNNPKGLRYNQFFLFSTFRTFHLGLINWQNAFFDSYTPKTTQATDASISYYPGISKPLSYVPKRIVTVDSDQGSTDVYLPEINTEKEINFYIADDGSTYYSPAFEERDDAGNLKNLARAAYCTTRDDCQIDHPVPLAYTCQENNIHNATHVTYDCANNKCVAALQGNLYETCDLAGGEHCREGIKCCMQEKDLANFFPIGVFYAEQIDQKLLDLGINTIVAGKSWFYNQNSYPQNSVDLIRQAQDKGLKVIVDDSKSESFIDPYTHFPLQQALQNRKSEQEIKNVVREDINNFCGLPNVIGFYQNDEPHTGWGYADEENEDLRIGVQALNQYGQYLSFNPIYDENLFEWNYRIGNDVLVYDGYVLFQDTPSSGPTNLFAFEDLIKRFRLAEESAKQFNKPWWYVPQAFEDPAFNFRYPSSGELYEQVYLALAYGAQGIIYFRYEDIGNDAGLLKKVANIEQPAELYPVAQEINQQLQKLGPLLLRLKPTGTANSRMLDAQPGPNLIAGGLWHDDRESDLLEWTKADSLRIVLHQKPGDADFFNFGIRDHIHLAEYPYIKIAYAINAFNQATGSGIGFHLQPKLNGKPLESSKIYTTHSLKKGDLYEIFNLEDYRKEKGKGTSINGDDSELGFFIDLYGSNDSLDLEIKNVTRATAELPSVRSVSGNFEVGTFVDESTGEKYVLLVNRDIQYPAVAEVVLKENNMKLVDAATDEAYRGTNEGRNNNFKVHFLPGRGKLLRIEGEHCLSCNTQEGCADFCWAFGTDCVYENGI
ncbi:MAG TPA: proprotein convertase P-domain-containing protein [Candidatus Nanoarchaeia archaeon]|nr:proprotein convertase P-domain-containing protein [Candidatus Nanoarchaeia archaeon]